MSRFKSFFKKKESGQGCFNPRLKLYTHMRIKLTLYACAYRLHPMKGKLNSLEVITRAPDQLGQAIERFRNRNDLSQASLAKSAGVRQATVSKVEKGLGTTEIETIFAVCAALGLEIVLRERNSQNAKLSIKELFK